MTPAEQAQETLGEINRLLETAQALLRSDLGVVEAVGEVALEAAVAELLGRAGLEAWLTPALLKLGAHLIRIATLVALEADNHVPPRSTDGARALFDLVTQPAPHRPALLQDHETLRWVLRLRADRFLILSREELVARFGQLTLEVVPSLRSGLRALEPWLDGRAVPPDTPEARAARVRHQARLEALSAAAQEVRALAQARGVEVRFFGSYVRGRVHEEPDLDVLVLGGEEDERAEAFIDELYGWAPGSGVPVQAVPEWSEPGFRTGSIP